MPSVAQVAASFVRHPFRSLVRKWNYKSAVMSSVVRGALFLVANLSAGLDAALAASAVEFAVRFCTAGFYGAITQAFGQAAPARQGALVAVICLPVLSHSLEAALHVWRGTPNLLASLGASVALTMASTAFNVFAMRRGVLIVGGCRAQTLGDDLRVLPVVIRDFAKVAVAAARRGLGAVAIPLAVAVVVVGHRGAVASPDDAPVQRFLGRAEPALTSYVGRRYIEVVNPRFNARAWMTVATTFDSVHGLTWTALGEGGSKYIRDNVIGKALATEVAAVRAGDPARSSVSPLNYEFLVDGVDAEGGARVLLTPRRRDRLLVRGSMSIDADGDLLEIRGRLAKSPSLWTPWVDVVRRYARIAGFRVAVHTEAVSGVRVAGRSSLRVVYDYTQINGVNVEPVERPSPWPPIPER